MAKEVGCSHTTVSAAFSEPRVPRWGLLELIVETLHGDTAAFHLLWLATRVKQPGAAAPPSAAPPSSVQPSSAPRQLPADVVAFTGRAEQLSALDALLDRAADAPALTVAAISGTAGVGKTALAVHWAHRVADRFPDGQLYIDLRGYDPDQPVDAAAALEVFLRVLDPAATVLPQGLPERAARYRTLLSGRRVLILLDNAYAVEQLRDLLPGTPSCFVVVTSRDTLPALVARHGATRLNLDLLAHNEAHRLLRALIGARVDAGPEAAAALAEHCARLPLALRIAAELAAARPTAALADLVDELGDESQRLDLLAAGGDEHTAVRAVFSWSIRHLQEPAASAFTLLGLHPGTQFDRAAATALTGARRVHLEALARAHLVEELGAGRLNLHDLLHAYAAELAAGLAEPVRRAALDALLDHYLDAARAALSRSDTTWLDLERANLIAAARSAPAYATRLSTVLAPYLDSRAHYRDALVLHGAARAVAADAGDRDGEATAWTLLGTANRRLGDYRAAIECYRRALTLCEGRAATLHGLGMTYWRLGRYDETLEALTRALDDYRAHDDRAGEGTTLYGIGLAEFQLGRYADARAHDEEAITVLRDVGDRTGEGRILNNIGVIERRSGHPAEALAYHERSLDIAHETGNRAGESVALINLGDLALEAGTLDVARDHYERALELGRHIGYRIGEADAMRGLGVMLGAGGRFVEALDHLRQAVALCHELGEHETHNRALIDLGDVLFATDRPEEALARYRAALGQATSTNDPYIRARALEAIATVLRALGDTTAAEHHHNQAARVWTGTPA